MNGKKVVVGLSGGVDSSVAEALLIEQGYEVEGVYLECYNEPGCRTDQDKADALKVAIKLGIQFQVLDFRKEYREKVIEYFYREYEVGRTPNPDIMCNREIKFGIFYDWALSQGFDFVATGHYCRIVGETLQRARDESKDQSYFLWQIPQDHLSHILFPLGEMLKSEVRTKARELGLHTASKPDSMGICFIGEVDVSELLKKKLGEQVGEVIYRGEVVGRHRGIWFYTIGSRGGWNLLPRYQGPDMEPLYVTAKDKDHNQLFVGKREETMRNQFEINSQIINSQILKFEKKLWVRIRNLGELHECSIYQRTNESTVIKTKEPVFGVAEGQSAVLYDSEGRIVGGGTIAN